MKTKRYVPYVALIRDLQGMGLRPGDTVLLHSSMKKIGPVEGGAEAVLDALQAYFTPGLLVLPALNWETIHLKPPAYDVCKTESMVGVLSELFRKRPGVHRSLNPTHSVCAFGEDAPSFVEGGDLDGTPLGPRSPWHKLVERDAFILMAGCDLTSCTLIHGVEEWCGIPGRLTGPIKFQVTLADGTLREITSRAHAAQPSPNYWKVQEGLTRTGLLKVLPFGNAPVMVLRARSLFHFIAGALSRDPHLFDEEIEEHE